jgi:hypothetical protein
MRTEGGVYDEEEFNYHAGIAAKGPKNSLNEGVVDTEEEAKDYHLRFASPLQGMLFDPSELDKGRDAAVAQHTVKGTGFVANKDNESVVRRELEESAMPTDLIKSLAGETTVQGGGPGPEPGKDASGWYSGYAEGGPITVKTGADSKPNYGTLIHEMGHRADFRSYGAEGPDSKHEPTVPALPHPNPRLEGIADGFVDRYLTRKAGQGDYAHIADDNRGYTINYDGSNQFGHKWTDAHRAVYAASRAHFAETGENPTVPGIEGFDVKENTPEYLHMMTRTSPHARQALMQHNYQTNYHGPLWDAAAQASRNYLSTRKVGTQLGMFDEVVAATDSTPDGPRSTYREHPVGFAVRSSLLSPEGAATEHDRKVKTLSAFQPPEGHVLYKGAPRHRSMDRELYDDPYANGVSQEQHAKVVASELAATKAKQSNKSRRAARGSLVSPNQN